MQNLERFAELIKKFKTGYGAGGIQHRVSHGWRLDLDEFFKRNEREFLNPVADNSKIFNPSMMGYKEDGQPYTLDELMNADEAKREMLLRQTEKNDMHFIKKIDLIIFYLDESAGFGTYTEFRENYDTYKKPFIIVRTISRRKLPHWIEWRRYEALMKTGNAIEFKTLTEMKEFFVKYMGFKNGK